MSRILLSLFMFVALVTVSPNVNAQITTPQPSPESTVKQKVGLTDVEIVYCRPGVKDRKIYGDLVPFGEIWRTGANASTKVKFSHDVKLGMKDVPAGEYALYMIPGESTWTIILHKNLTYWGVGDYKQEEDLLRFDVKSSKLNDKVETMTINFADITMESANINLDWENTRVSIPLTVEVDSKVQADIDKAMKGVTPGTYYSAASYYLAADKDQEQALNWINKALEKEEKFWYVRKKALILANLGKYKDAIAAATRSMELAKEADNSNYVESNKKSIAEWTEMLKK